MDLMIFLNAFGLTETEGRVYLAALAKPHVSVSELAKTTSLKRPALYHAVETLEKKGLISAIRSGKILRFRAESPEQLKSLLHRRALEVERLEKRLTKTLPFFPTPDEESSGVARVEFFRGKEAIRNLAERSLENDGKELFGIIPSFDFFLETLTHEFAAYYVEEKRKRGIKTKSVWAKPLQDEQEFTKHVSDHATFFREVRFAPENIARSYRSIILIWDDSVAIINTSAELFGVLITSKDYADTMKTLWSVLWGVSQSSE